MNAYEIAKAEYEARNEVWRKSAEAAAYYDRCRKRDDANQAFERWLAERTRDAKPHGCGYGRSLSAGNSAGRT